MQLHGQLKRKVAGERLNAVKNSCMQGLGVILDSLHDTEVNQSMPQYSEKTVAATQMQMCLLFRHSSVLFSC